VYKAGSEGLTMPRILSEVKPTYTAAMISSGTQGIVRLDCVVLPSGRVGHTRVTQSLGAQFDAEAVRTLRRWRFQPGTKDGTPVPVEVFVEISFDTRF
jgi:protein TonB